MLPVVLLLSACLQPVAEETAADDVADPTLPPVPGPALVESLPAASVPRVLVNEIMADNESTLQEADGSFSDWFELYNASDTPVDLGRITVSRKDATWVGGVGTLAPGGHLLVKADGGLHEGSAPFVLDADGNKLTVTVDGVETHEVNPGPLPSDVAALRYPDGGAWRFGIRPTPGYTNMAAGTDSVDPRDSLFQKDHIPVLYVTVSDEAYEALDRRAEVDASILFDGIRFERVRMSLKGSGSFQPMSGKPALKFDLNDLDDTRRMRGLKKLTFNNGVTWDPTWTHEWLTYSIFREAGIAAPRVGWARVFVNGVDYGLYMDVETWDDELIERWFSDAATGGTLYEGSDFSVGAQLHLEEGPDRSDWIDAVAQDLSVNNDFSTLRQLVDMDEFTTYMALEEMTLQFDGYEAPNNWRLYINSAGIGRWVPTGVDYTWSYSSGDCWSGNGLVFRACKNDATCRALFTQKLIDMADLIDTMYLPDEFEDVTAFLTPQIVTDPRTPHGAATIASAQADTLDLLESHPDVCRKQAEAVLGD